MRLCDGDPGARAIPLELKEIKRNDLARGDLPYHSAYGRGFAFSSFDSIALAVKRSNLMILKRSPAFDQRVFYLSLALLLGVLAACAEVQVRTLPPPPPTPKLRVFVQAITEPGKWRLSEEEFTKRVPRCVERVLMETGIYEMVSLEDSRSILAGAGPLTRWDWAKKDWGLARRVGKGLHADYGIIIIRSRTGGYIFWEMTFLNVKTGEKYRSVSRTSFQRYLGVEDYAHIFRIKYREIFREARRDLLATAIQKSHVALLVTSVQPDPGQPPPPPPAASPTSRITRGPKEEKPPAASPRGIKEAKALPPVPVEDEPKSPVAGRTPTAAVQSAPPPPQISRPLVKEKALPAAPVEEKLKSPDTGRVPTVPAQSAPPPPQISGSLVKEKVLPGVSVEEKLKSPDTGRVPTVPAHSVPLPPQISGPPVKEKALPVVSKEIGEVPQELAGAPVLDLEKILTTESKPDGRKRLAVYDLETSEPLKVVALILSESLREELIRLGSFALVNRENLVQVLKEIELQMTGLVDEKQAVKVGKGLAANQIVLGRYGALGNTAILQAKRIDVESQGTLAMGSLKCSQGREDELLAHMSDLARKLAGGI
jgi:hypothetical protein